MGNAPNFAQLEYASTNCRNMGNNRATEPPEKIKFYVAGDGKVSIVCPACGYTKTIQASLIPSTKKRFVAKCKCGHRFSCFIEFRQHYRKQVRITGQCHVPGTEATFNILVGDLSIGGLRFTCDDAYMPTAKDILDISFCMDGHNQKLIEKKVSVVFIQKDSVGAEFIDERHNLFIRFYLSSSAR